MRLWSERSPEIAYLLNPAFCARILYGVIDGYEKEKKEKFPFLLSYLVLPIVLHKKTRQRIKTITKMQVWLQRNQELLIDFSKRAKSLVSITNEAIEFLLQYQVIIIDGANISIKNKLKQAKLKDIEDEEMLGCFETALALGKWFARNGTVENIYQSWGVRP